MRIKRIRIENFRNFRSVDITPGASPLVFIGENNTGKSNLALALRLLLGTDARRLTSQLSELDINFEARKGGADSFSVQLDVGDLQSHLATQAVFYDFLGDDSGDSFVSIRGEFAPAADGTYEFNASVLPESIRKNDPGPLTGLMARALPIYYLDPVRDAISEVRTTGSARLSQILRDLDLSDVQTEVATAIKEANAALAKNEGLARIATEVSRLLQGTTPRGQGAIEMGVASDDPSRLVENVRIGLKGDPASPLLDLLRHGTGTQNLVLLAMLRFQMAQDPASTPILVVEEPEAHLHVQVQRALMNELATLTSPVLVTTHSPTIVAMSPPFSLVRLKGDTPAGTAARALDPAGITADDLDDLQLFMRNGRAEALFGRSAVLVEGPSEAIALPAFARHLGAKLDREGVVIVAAESNRFAFLLNSLAPTAFDVPCVVAFDADSLRKDHVLLQEAEKAGLLTPQQGAAARALGVSDKVGILSKLGWIPAMDNFEQEVAQAGYLPIMEAAIKAEGAEKRYVDFLAKVGMKRDAVGIAAYLAKEKNFKIPVARAIASNASAVGTVPKCYSDALQRAISLAT